MHVYDLLVIGSGPGGYRAAVLGKLRGLDVGIVEKDVWGGTCLNRGCVPKKDWHHTANLIAASQHSTHRGFTGTLHGDLQAAWQHQHETVNHIRSSYTDYLRRSGIHSWNGTARFVDAQTIVVGDRQLQARNFIIATGSHPHIPEGYTLTPGRILTTDELFDAPPPPGRRIALVGSGVIGTEFAYILTQLGCKVLWLADRPPLSRSDFSPAALDLLKAELLKYDIIRLPRPSRVSVDDDHVRLDFSDGRQEQVDWLVLGAGREPHTEGLGLDTIGVETDRHGFIKVDPWRQTNVAHVFAIGDVANHKMTANHALADADLAIANILKPRSRLLEIDTVPEMVYSALELGRIGMSEDMAIDSGYEPAVGFAAFETNPRAVGQDESTGFVRLIADIDNGHLVGAEVIGSEAGEIIHTLSVQLGNDEGLNKLAHTFYNHPARTEEIRNAVETLAAKWGLREQVFGA